MGLPPRCRDERWTVTPRACPCRPIPSPALAGQADMPARPRRRRKTRRVSRSVRSRSRPDLPPSGAGWFRERFLKMQSRWNWRLAGQLAKTLPAWLKNPTSKEWKAVISESTSRHDTRAAACDRKAAVVTIYDHSPLPWPLSERIRRSQCRHREEDDIATVGRSIGCGSPRSCEALSRPPPGFARRTTGGSGRWPTTPSRAAGR